MWKLIRALLAKVTRRRGKPRATLTAVCLLPDPNDRMVVIDTALSEDWDVLFAADAPDAERCLHVSPPQIVLLDRNFAEGDWRRMMAACAAGAPDACILLVSAVRDDLLWNEVVACGGYEVLAKPLNRDDVARAIRLARSYRGATRSNERKYQVSGSEPAPNRTYTRP